MKKNFSIILIAFVVMSLSFAGCSKKEHKGYQPNNQGQNIVVQEAVPNIGENLNLQSVGEIVKTSKNPQEMEERLNAKDGVNNLDLDGDGQTDFLTVTEYGEGNQHGYSICANLNDNSKPEVANIQVDASTREVTISGNQEYYGNNATYHSTFDATDFLLLAWMMQPHYGYYHSPYYYGHYGYGYAPRPVVAYHAYNSRPVVRTRTTTYRNIPRSQSTSKIQSPNANNKSTAATRTTNLSKPTQSQKSFKVNNNSGKPTQVNGFGNKTKSQSTSPSANSTPSKSNSPSKSYSPSKSNSPSKSYSPSKSSSPSRSSSSRSSSSRSSGGRRH